MSARARAPPEQPLQKLRSRVRHGLIPAITLMESFLHPRVILARACGCILKIIARELARIILIMNDLSTGVCCLMGYFFFFCERLLNPRCVCVIAKKWVRGG